MIEINQWHERYEVNSSGQPAKDGDELRQSPLNYVRDKVYGHKQGAGYRMLLRIAGHVRAMQVYGIFKKFIELAADRKASERGKLYNAHDEPATEEDLAFILDVPLTQIRFAIQVLSDKRLAWILIDSLPEIQGIQGIPESLQEAKLIKAKGTKANTTNEQQVFEKWNSYKGKKGWKSHNSLSYETRQAITERLKQYSVDDLCAAIDNYASILFSPNHAVFNIGKQRWNKFWTLREFLLRSTKTDRNEKYLYRFLPSVFAPTDFLTLDAQQHKRRAKDFKAQQREMYEDAIKRANTHTLLEWYEKDVRLRWLIDELRPEIKDLAKN